MFHRTHRRDQTFLWGRGGGQKNRWKVGTLIGISIRLRGIRKISFVGFLINVNIKSNIEFVAFVMVKALKAEATTWSAFPAFFSRLSQLFSTWRGWFSFSWNTRVKSDFLVIRWYHFSSYREKNIEGTVINLLAGYNYLLVYPKLLSRLPRQKVFGL